MPNSFDITKDFDESIVLTKANFICRDEIYDDFYGCECGSQDLMDHHNYCSSCGRSLKWELI